MDLLSLLRTPLAVASTVLFAILLGLAAQRLLGIRLGPVRLLATGLFATTVLPLIGLALVGGPATMASADPQVAFWFFLLAAMCTLLASMAFIVVVEAFAPLGSIPPATVWGRGVRGRWRRTRRTWQVTGLALRHGLGQYLRDRRRLEGPTARAQLGRALRATLTECGVTFVKMGQILSTRADVLPPEIAAELAVLRDDARPVPWQDVERVIIEELGEPPTATFAEIDQSPLAAASIGQVHAARLHSGEEVVVKVQRPGVRPTVERDLDIALRLGARLERTTAWGRSLGTRALAQALGTAVREELDYRIEADNILAVARTQPVGSVVRVPMPYSELSTDRVLVMERLQGLSVSGARPLLDRLGTDPNELARTILDTLLHQIVIEGVFHADPHPGNIFLLRDGNIGLLDFGSVGRLDTLLREGVGRLLLGFHHGDRLAVTDALLEVAPGADDVDIDVERLQHDVGRLMARAGIGSSTPGRSADLFGDLFTLVAAHRLQISPEMAAVFRSLATVEGTLRVLAPEFDLVGTSRELSGRYLTEQLTPDALRRTATEELTALLPMLRRLPRRIERITAAAEHNRLSIAVRPFAHEGDRSWLTRRIHDILITGLAGIIGLMGALLVGLGGGPEIRESVELHPFIGYNLLVISAVLGLRVLAQVFRQRQSGR